MASLLIIGGLGLLGAYAVPTLIGFGSTGIVAGSIAAGIQSAIGNVAAGSIFATLTSWGMTGTFTLLGKIGLSSIVVGIASKLNLMGFINPPKTDSSPSTEDTASKINLKDVTNKVIDIGKMGLSSVTGVVAKLFNKQKKNKALNAFRLWF